MEIQQSKAKADGKINFEDFPVFLQLKNEKLLQLKIFLIDRDRYGANSGTLGK